MALETRMAPPEEAVLLVKLVWEMEGMELIEDPRMRIAPPEPIFFFFFNLFIYFWKGDEEE